MYSTNVDVLICSPPFCGTRENEGFRQAIQFERADLALRFVFSGGKYPTILHLQTVSRPDEKKNQATKA